MPRCHPGEPHIIVASAPALPSDSGAESPTPDISQVISNVFLVSWHLARDSAT